MYYYTMLYLFNGHYSRTAWLWPYQNLEPFWVLLWKEMMEVINIAVHQLIW